MTGNHSLEILLVEDESSDVVLVKDALGSRCNRRPETKTASAVKPITGRRCPRFDPAAHTERFTATEIAEPSTFSTTSRSEPATNERRTVLLIDDDPAFRLLCARLLEAAPAVQYDVLEAGTGKAALHLMATRHIDKVLIDYALPDRTGAKLMQDIQQSFPEWPGSMVMITSAGSEEVAAEALRAGAADYVSKQISPERFRANLYRALDRARLRSAIRRKNQELAHANFQLHSRTSEITRFYHQVSHEAKTPLTAARMFMSILHEGLVGELTPEQREVVEQAIESCDQLTGQFNDLIECTRLETGKLPLRKSLQSLPRIIQRSVIALQPTFEEKSIELMQCIASDIPSFLMDGGRIFQVLANVLGNGAKFISPQGGRMVLSAHVSAAPGNWVEIWITDNGCGISEKHLPRIFDRLYQVEVPGDSLQGANLGLGLTIAKEIVELHRGTIDVQSKVGEGTTFIIRLPMLTDGRCEMQEQSL